MDFNTCVVYWVIFTKQVDKINYNYHNSLCTIPKGNILNIIYFISAFIKVHKIKIQITHRGRIDVYESWLSSNGYWYIF